MIFHLKMGINGVFVIVVICDDGVNLRAREAILFHHLFGTRACSMKQPTDDHLHFEVASGNPCLSITNFE